MCLVIVINKSNVKIQAEHENMKSEHFAGEVVEEAEKWMEAMHLASMAVDVAGLVKK